MNVRGIFFTIVLIMTQSGVGQAGLLTAQNFPKNVDDLSFSERNEILTTGYEPYAGLSPYQILQIEDLNEALSKEIDQMEEDNQNYCQNEGKNTRECQPVTDEVVQNQNSTEQSVPEQQGPSNPQVNQQPPSVSPGLQSQQKPNTNTTGYCAMRHSYIPSGQKYPIGVPVAPDLDIYTKARNGTVCSKFGVYRGKKKNGNVHYHQGVDLGCNASYFGTPVFATASGVVKNVQPASKCKASGNMIKIEHSDGFVSYYMHLDKMFVKVGDVVDAGCQIGTMGHTGGNLVTNCPKMGIDITHLHYELRHPKKKSTIKIGNKSIQLQYKNGTSFDPVPLMKI